MWRSAQARGSNAIERCDVEMGASDAIMAFEEAVCAPLYDGLTSAQRLFVTRSLATILNLRACQMWQSGRVECKLGGEVSRKLDEGARNRARRARPGTLGYASLCELHQAARMSRPSSAGLQYTARHRSDAKQNGNLKGNAGQAAPPCAIVPSTSRRRYYPPAPRKEPPDMLNVNLALNNWWWRDVNSAGQR